MSYYASKCYQRKYSSLDKTGNSSTSTMPFLMVSVSGELLVMHGAEVSSLLGLSADLVLVNYTVTVR